MHRLDVEGLAVPSSSVLPELLTMIDPERLSAAFETARCDLLAERDDVITDGDCRDDVLANAPETEAGFYVVPKVIE